MGKTDLITLRVWQGTFKGAFRRPRINTLTPPLVLMQNKEYGGNMLPGST